MAVRGAYLEYEADGKRYQHPMWVTEISQTHALSGSQQQGRLSRQFYPRGYMPGDYAVQGICRNQKEYQQLALFIRRHHRDLINVPSTEVFSQLDINAPGYRRLLKFSLASEGILGRGFISTFTISKRGVMEPAPKFAFNFRAVFDAHSTNLHISRALTEYYKRGAIVPPKVSGDLSQVGGTGEQVGASPSDFSAVDVLTRG